ncbi:MAG TPA: twin-arginine translocase TatA/TatE family subunit [Roseiflexaceae bacterium]|nr:twin-arginine translocase TatA/TatE family subunit [Roseiflexaceae bacterium]
MEILGIGPGEFILILIVLLVVVGPERLPGLARQAGSLLVRARNWLQTSPDAALVLRARQEIEAELASIKASLMEVQVVRDEVLGAAKQLEDSVGSITSTRIDLNPLVKPPAEQTVAANGQTLSSAEAPALQESTETSATPLDQRSTIDLPGESDVPIATPAETQPTNGLTNGVAHAASPPAPAIATPAAAAQDVLESINIRLQAIMSDMWALQQQLKQRGALDEDWQPPSFDVQLPTHETAPLAGPESSAAPAEDEAVVAARKLLEQLTPMNVSYHAPPVVEAAPDDNVPTDDPVAETTASPAAPARKTRKRRAAPPAADALETAQASEQDTSVPASPAAPARKTRKRRAAAASAERGDEIEPITTEKAS